MAGQIKNTVQNATKRIQVYRVCFRDRHRRTSQVTEERNKGQGPHIFMKQDPLHLYRTGPPHLYPTRPHICIEQDHTFVSNPTPIFVSNRAPHLYRTGLHICIEQDPTFVSNRAPIFVSKEGPRIYIYICKSDPERWRVHVTGTGPGSTLHTRWRWTRYATGRRRSCTRSTSPTTRRTRSKWSRARGPKISVRTSPSD